MPTIREVAERAGVSTMTVSRVINNSGYTSREARERVEAAIADMGYVPNALARSLRFKQTKTLALVLSDITNPFFTTIARGVEDIANRNGFNVIFGNTDESESKQAEYLNILVQKQVDGVLLIPARSTEGPVAFLRNRGVPVVVLDRRVPECSTDGVLGNLSIGVLRKVPYQGIDTGPGVIPQRSSSRRMNAQQVEQAGGEDDLTGSPHQHGSEPLVGCKQGGAHPCHAAADDAQIAADGGRVAHRRPPSSSPR
jgi:LacI family transcriptional regulator